MLKKIKLKHKWLTGRNKVIKRYEKFNFICDFPQPVVYEEGEDLDLYMQILSKYLFYCRCTRLNHIAIRTLNKKIKFYRRAVVIWSSITASLLSFVIGWFLGVFLR